MKAWWKIYDKPRGRWRPLMEAGVAMTSQEIESAKELNVSLHIKYCLRGDVTGQLTSCPSKDVILIVLPERPYGNSGKQVGFGKSLGSSYPCDNCPGGRSGWYDVDGINLPNNCLSFRLPWRPGARPDYGDFIRPIREFLRLVLEELERRFAEARESAPSDEWLLEEEFDSFSWRTTENGAEVAERKLRVIRK